MQACRLIQEHKLLSSVHASSPMDWIMETMFSHDTFRVRPPPPQPRIADVEVTRPKDPESKNIAILQPAWCSGCGQRIRHGTFATWSRGEVWHPSCYAHATGQEDEDPT